MTTEPMTHGHTSVPARLESWQGDVVAGSAEVTRLIDNYGSPVNLIDTGLVGQHADELVSAAEEFDVDLRVFFARKANKALSVVDAALAAGHGVDVASAAELEQTLSRGADPSRIIVTAAVKPPALLRLALRDRVLISVDNLDELRLIERLADEEDHPKPARLAIRLTPEGDGIPWSRFGLGRDDALSVIRQVEPSSLSVEGLHFHLNGYSHIERAAMLHRALDIVDAERDSGHPLEFIDMGGGVPIRYLDDPGPWRAFTESVSTGAEPLWDSHVLGTVYPMWQDLVRGEWLRALLETNRVGVRLRESGVRLHIEPGRALLDGAGMTVARVEFRKQRPDGTWVIGLAMNRTQLRSAADDFILDPILIPADKRQPTDPIDGFLVGAYCIENELITWRRLQFPQGVAVGDHLAFVNTAGYMMHILESTSHRMPLAINLFRTGDGWELDPIDAAD